LKIFISFEERARPRKNQFLSPRSAFLDGLYTYLDGVINAGYNRRRPCRFHFSMLVDYFLLRSNLILQRTCFGPNLFPLRRILNLKTPLYIFTPPHTIAFHSCTRPRPAHSSSASRTHPYLRSLSRFDSHAIHARTIHPAAPASVPFGYVLVRQFVRVLIGKQSQHQPTSHVTQHTGATQYLLCFMLYAKEH